MQLDKTTRLASRLLSSRSHFGTDPALIEMRDFHLVEDRGGGRQMFTD